jgi:hypothetical protein
MAKYKYTIDADGVKIFENDATAPFLLQPNWPDGQAWAEGEAEAWATQKILELTDATADFAGHNPDNPVIFRTPVEPAV